LDKAYVAYDPVRGYHKGFGFVIFEELEDAHKVLTIKCHFIQDVRVLVTKNLLKNEYKLKKEKACLNKLEKLTNKFDEMDLGKTSAPIQNESYSEAPRYYQYVADPQCYNIPYRGIPETYPGEGARYLSYQNLDQGNQVQPDIPGHNVRYPIAPSLGIGADNCYANGNYSQNCLGPMPPTSISRANQGTPHGQHHMKSGSYAGSEAMYSGFDRKDSQLSMQTLLSYPSNSGPVNNQTPPGMFPYSHQGYGKSQANGSFNKLESSNPSIPDYSNFSHVGMSSGNIPCQTIVGSHQNPPMNTNLSFAVSYLTDSENTRGQQTATNLSGYMVGDSGKDVTKTTASTANPVSMSNVGPQNPAPLKYLANPRKGGPVMMRSNTIEEELLGQFGERPLSPMGNLLSDIEPRILDDGPGVSSNSITDFLRVPAHMKIISSNKIVGQSSLKRKESRGKRGSICSEGGSSGEEDCKLEILRPAKRRKSAFKYDGLKK
jgi:hypothetical protein